MAISHKGTPRDCAKCIEQYDDQDLPCENGEMGCPFFNGQFKVAQSRIVTQKKRRAGMRRGKG